MSSEPDTKAVVNDLIRSLKKDLDAATDFDERQKLTHQLLQAIGMQHRLQGKSKGKGFNLG